MREKVSDLDRVLCRGSGAVRQGARQADDDLDGVILGDQFAQPAQVLPAAVPRNRFHRGGEDPIGIAGGHSDSDSPDVDAEAPATAGVVTAGPVGQPVLA